MRMAGLAAPCRCAARAGRLVARGLAHADPAGAAGARWWPGIRSSRPTYRGRRRPGRRRRRRWKPPTSCAHGVAPAWRVFADPPNPSSTASSSAAACPTRTRPRARSASSRALGVAGGRGDPAGGGGNRGRGAAAPRVVRPAAPCRSVVVVTTVGSLAAAAPRAAAHHERPGHAGGGAPDALLASSIPTGGGAPARASAPRSSSCRSCCSTSCCTRCHECLAATCRDAPCCRSRSPRPSRPRRCRCPHCPGSGRRRARRRRAGRAPALGIRAGPRRRLGRQHRLPGPRRAERRVAAAARRPGADLLGPARPAARHRRGRMDRPSRRCGRSAATTATAGLDGSYRPSPTTYWHANASCGLRPQRLDPRAPRAGRLAAAGGHAVRGGGPRAAQDAARAGRSASTGGLPHRVRLAGPHRRPELRGTAGLERPLGSRTTAALEYAVERVRSDQAGRSYLTHFASVQWTRLAAPRGALLLEAGASYTPDAARAGLDQKESFFGGASFSAAGAAVEPDAVRAAGGDAGLWHRGQPPGASGGCGRHRSAGPHLRAARARARTCSPRPRSTGRRSTGRATTRTRSLGRRLGRHLEVSARSALPAPRGLGGLPRRANRSRPACSSRSPARTDDPSRRPPASRPRAAARRARRRRAASPRPAPEAP